MKITRAVVPSLFTVLNMFSGFMSILHASRGEFIAASWFIIGGDLRRARRRHGPHHEIVVAFGVEFDSLSDVVSFGAAPSFLVYQIDLHRLDGVGVLVSSLPMIFGGLRLARFNWQLKGFDKDYFVGLPIPMSALTIVSSTLLLLIRESASRR